MAVTLRDIDSRLQHQCAEWNATNPRDETKYQERYKYQEHDASAVVPLGEHVDCCYQPKNDTEH